MYRCVAFYAQINETTRVSAIFTFVIPNTFGISYRFSNYFLSKNTVLSTDTFLTCGKPRSICGKNVDRGGIRIQKTNITHPRSTRNKQWGLYPTPKWHYSAVDESFDLANINWMPSANSPIAANAKIPVPMVLNPTTKVRTAAEIRWTVRLSD
jgi:hypothetical protein